jgi:hypothetical protein
MFYLGLLGSELVYEDVFSVWETIWAAKHIASSHFVLFIALALVESYRDIILSNSMDFTDIIKFFNGLYQILSLLELSSCHIRPVQLRYSLLWHRNFNG